MKMKEYDFSNAKRGSVIPHPGKTRITIWIDNSTLEWFRKDAQQESRGYQTGINSALKSYIEHDQRPLQDIVREAVREGLKDLKKTG